MDCTPPARSVAARGQLLFGIAQKVTKKASPYTPLHPAVLATGGTRTNRPDAALTRSHWAHGATLGPPVAALLRANQWGPGVVVDLMASGIDSTAVGKES